MGTTGTDTTSADAARALAAEQERVAAIVASLPAAGWRAELSPPALERLVALGHFPQYAHELAWSPREVVGHLRDSAEIFTDRIGRLRAEARPYFVDFVTDDPARIADYRSTGTDALVAQLAAAQARLLAAVRSVAEGELDRGGEHEVDGEVTLRGILAFLPAHQRDHREQLTALTDDPLG